MFAEMQLVYSAAQVDWARWLKGFRIFKKMKNKNEPILNKNVLEQMYCKYKA